MTAYSLIVIFFCCICENTSVDIMPELKRNILNFGYELALNMGECHHTTFYVVTKFALPTMEDLKFLPITFDSFFV